MPVACVGCSCPCKCPRGGKVPRGGGRQQSFPNQLRGLKQQLGEWWNRLVKGQTPGAKESREEWEEAELRLQRTSREESSRNREFLRSAWQHGGARGACTNLCPATAKPQGLQALVITCRSCVQAAGSWAAQQSEREVVRSDRNPQGGTEETGRDVFQTAPLARRPAHAHTKRCPLERSSPRYKAQQPCLEISQSDTFPAHAAFQAALPAFDAFFSYLISHPAGSKPRGSSTAARPPLSPAVQTCFPGTSIVWSWLGWEVTAFTRP